MWQQICEMQKILHTLALVTKQICEKNEAYELMRISLVWSPWDQFSIIITIYILRFGQISILRLKKILKKILKKNGYFARGKGSSTGSKKILTFCGFNPISALYFFYFLLHFFKMDESEAQK
jgi:hypothetical protein